MILAAMNASPSSCSSPIGDRIASRAVDVTADQIGLSSEYVFPGDSGRQARLGRLIYHSGLIFHSNDPRLVDLDTAFGRVYSRRSKCWFDFQLNGQGSNADMRVVDAPKFAATYSALPPNFPIIPGFELIDAYPAQLDGFLLVGIWNAKNAGGRSKIVAFNSGKYLELAEITARLGGISALPDLHTNGYHIRVIGENANHGAVLLQLTWEAEPTLKSQQR